MGEAKVCVFDCPSVQMMPQRAVQMLPERVI
jgi:hypothetical protein